MKQSLYSQKVSLNYRVSFEYFGGNWLCFNLTIVWSSRIILPSSLNYKTHFSRQLNCWSLRCSWSIACQRCSSYIFIVDATTGLNGLGKDNCKKRRESVKFWDLLHLILEILQYFTCDDSLRHIHVIMGLHCTKVSPSVSSMLHILLFLRQSRALSSPGGSIKANSSSATSTPVSTPQAPIRFNLQNAKQCTQSPSTSGQPKVSWAQSQYKDGLSRYGDFHYVKIWGFPL